MFAGDRTTASTSLAGAAAVLYAAIIARRRSVPKGSFAPDPAACAQVSPRRKPKIEFGRRRKSRHSAGSSFAAENHEP